MWNPGFAPEESIVARLEGYARSFCMASVTHRGCEADPGLVLALDETAGASCMGVALKVSAHEVEEVLAYLRERELVTSAYLERHLELTLTDGRTVEALAYVIDPDHRQYCGGLPLEEQAQVIARARGGKGPNAEYLWNTARQLEALGLADEELTWLSMRVQAILGEDLSMKRQTP